MKLIVYEDSRGYLRRSLVRDEDGEKQGEYGVPYSPPDIGQLDWEAIKREVNNTLVNMEAFTLQRFNKDQIALHASNVLKRHLIQLYREAEEDMKRKELELKKLVR